jgi:hypothetical protein
MSEDTNLDLEALNLLIVDCPDLEHLESMLGGFNLFQVLKFEYGEIRHSNVLAWLLDPSESHGLNETFLKKWLMRVVHETSGDAPSPVRAVDIDAWQLLGVQVHREWQNIDMLLVLTFSKQEEWVICVENKVNSTQSKGQLRKYRSLVEKEFSNATHRIYLFLTKNGETPDDDSYIGVTYDLVHKVLKECISAKSHVIGAEPRVLLDSYIRLLEEKFMDESEIARTARKIYQQHRRALDVIFEQRPDNLKLVSDKVRALLENKLVEIDFVIDSYSKSYIRLIPIVWDHPGNRLGNAWSNSKRTMVFELNLNSKRTKFYAISGMAPVAWIAPLWEQSKHQPFHGSKKASQPAKWCSLHIFNSRISLNEENIIDPEEAAEKICNWCLSCIKESSTQEVIKIIADQLPALQSAFTDQAK